MPKLDSATAALFMSRSGAGLLIGQVTDQVDDAARTDTFAADGERQLYRSGATIVLQVFDKAAGVWRARSLV